MSIIHIPTRWESFTNKYRSPIWRFFNRREIKDFNAFSFPIIRQMAPPLLLQDLINVQPMNEKSGEVFYLDFIHNKKKWWQFWR